MMTRVIADTINGVTKVETFDDIEHYFQFQPQQDFYDSLKFLGNLDVIGSVIDDDMYNLIDEEYGIS